MSPYLNGKSWGVIWGNQADVYERLGDLAALRVSLDLEAWCHWFVGTDEQQPACQRILGILMPEVDTDRAAFAAFWSFIPAAPTKEATLLHPDFVLGFADGALEMWYRKQAQPGAAKEH